MLKIATSSRFEPMEIPYIRMCHEMGLGVGKFGEIEVVGENISTFI